MEQITKERCDDIVETVIYSIIRWTDSDEERNEMIKRVRKELKKCIDKKYYV